MRRHHQPVFELNVVPVRVGKAAGTALPGGLFVSEALTLSSTLDSCFEREISSEPAPEATDTSAYLGNRGCTRSAVLAALARKLGGSAYRGGWVERVTRIGLELNLWMARRYGAECLHRPAVSRETATSA